MTNVVILAVVAGLTWGQAGESPVSQSELAPPGAAKAQEETQPAPSDVIRPAEAPEPAPTEPAPREPAPAKPDAQAASPPRKPAPERSSAPGKRVAAFWIIVPGK